MMNHGLVLRQNQAYIGTSNNFNVHLFQQALDCVVLPFRIAYQHSNLFYSARMIWFKPCTKFREVKVQLTMMTIVDVKCCNFFTFILRFENVASML